MKQQIIECVPNISEGRDLKKIKTIANVVTEVEGVKLLDIDPGKATNRTVITFVGEMVIEEQQDGTMEFPKYAVSKKKVLYLLEKLKSYSTVTHTFRKVKESFEDEHISVYQDASNQKTVMNK